MGNTSSQTQQRHGPPFRAEHIGSLLRSDELLKKRQEVDRGEASESELKRIEDRDIKSIVKIQLKLGYHAITDGEYRRHSREHTNFELEGISYGKYKY
jgi:methionine synthase II (cobalamin-independent)